MLYNSDASYQTAPPAVKQASPAECAAKCDGNWRCAGFVINHLDASGRGECHLRARISDTSVAVSGWGQFRASLGGVETWSQCDNYAHTDLHVRQRPAKAAALPCKTQPADWRDSRGRSCSWYSAPGRCNYAAQYAEGGIDAIEVRSQLPSASRRFR